MKYDLAVVEYHSSIRPNLQTATEAAQVSRNNRPMTYPRLPKSSRAKVSRHVRRGIQLGDQLLERLGSAARGSRLHHAGTQLGSCGERFTCATTPDSQAREVHYRSETTCDEGSDQVSRSRTTRPESTMQCRTVQWARAACRSAPRRDTGRASCRGA